MIKKIFLLALLVTCFAKPVVAMQPTTPETWWFHAAATGEIDTIDHMIRDGAVAVNVVKEYNGTALMIATSEGMVNVVRRLLQVQGINVNATLQTGESAIQYALEGVASHWNRVRRNSRKIIRLLVRRPEIDITLRNPNRNQNSGYFNMSLDELRQAFPMTTEALWFSAAEDNDLRVIDRMIRAQDVNVNAKNEDGATALIVAACKGHFGVVKRLLRVPEIDIDVKDRKEGLTAFEWNSKNTFKPHYLEIAIAIPREKAKRRSGNLLKNNKKYADCYMLCQTSGCDAA